MSDVLLPNAASLLPAAPSTSHAPPVAAALPPTAKLKRRKSRFRDVEFGPAFLKAAASGSLGPELEAVMMRDAERSLARSKKIAHSTASPPATSTSPTAGADHVRKPRIWSQRGGPTTRKHRKPAEWRDATKLVKAQIAHVVLDIAGPIHSFTLNLGKDVEAQALAKGRLAKRWLSDRIARNLTKALGRPVPFWFRLEMGQGDNPYLHLHGEIGCADSELATVREALRDCGGNWSGTIQSQAHTGRGLAPDMGWASYATKPDVIADYLRSMAPSEPSWRDDDFMMTQELSRAAKALYGRVRKHITIDTMSLREADKLVAAASS